MFELGAEKKGEVELTVVRLTSSSSPELANLPSNRPLPFPEPSQTSKPPRTSSKSHLPSSYLSSRHPIRSSERFAFPSNSLSLSPPSVARNPLPPQPLHRRASQWDGKLFVGPRVLHTAETHLLSSSSSSRSKDQRAGSAGTSTSRD
jgi:hypothetical protein